MLQRIALRVNRASHTVEQLLTLARVDPDAPLPATELDLRALLVEVLAETAHLAADRGLQVEIEEGGQVPVRGSQEALAILMRNLLANAFRYAGDGSTVEIRLGSEDGARLAVCNDCQPLSAEEFGRICQRFYRVPGSPGLGAGLGLSIVTRIADQHGAEFSVGPREMGSGFCARMSFAPP